MSELPWDDLCASQMLRDENLESPRRRRGASGRHHTAQQPDNSQEPATPWNLQGFLLSTYGSPDHRLLSQHLLPSWMDLPIEDAEDARAHQFDMERRLCGMLGRSSLIIADEQPEADWLWRHVRVARVGRRRRTAGRIAQHAKLWILWFQRRIDGEIEDALEVVVSSANLSMSAFTGQTQAAWRCVTTLRPKGPSGASRRQSAPTRQLDSFLAALAEDLDPVFAPAMANWRTLVERATWPDELAGFACSVPGFHRRDRSWGIASWAKTAPSRADRLRVLSPSLGDWSERAAPNAFDAFVRAAVGPGGQLQVVRPIKRERAAGRWLSQAWSAWAAPRHVLADFQERCVGDGPILVGLDSQHPLLSGSKASDRWFHGKIYEAVDARGRVSHRYIGSANFSPAAWGTPRKGGYVITNYEIGVLLRVKGGDPWIIGDDTPGLDSHLLKDESDPADQPEVTAPWSSWCWDGLQLTARVLVPKALHGQQVVVTVTDADGKEETFERLLASRSGGIQELRFPHPTAIAHISIAWPKGARESIVPIDLRPAEQVYEDLIDQEAKEDAGDTYLEAMLRRFGGGIDPDDESARRRQRRQPGSDMVGDGADYRQPWMEDARRVGLAIDGWQRAMHEALGHSGYADEGQVAILRVDARRLIDYLIRRADGLRLSHPLRAAAWEVMAEELKLRSGDSGGRG